MPAHPLVALFDALLAFGHSTICTVWERDCPEAESLLRDWCATNGAELIACGGHVSAFKNDRTIVTVQRQQADRSDVEMPAEKSDASGPRAVVDVEQMWRPAP